jgi:hypothetical protein
MNHHYKCQCLACVPHFSRSHARNAKYDDWPAQWKIKMLEAQLDMKAFRNQLTKRRNKIIHEEVKHHERKLLKIARRIGANPNVQDPVQGLSFN